MQNQLTELLTHYGPVQEIWFDGGWDKKPEEWQLPRIYSHIKKLQPTCAVGVNHTIVLKEGKRKFALPDSMIVDNNTRSNTFQAISVYGTLKLPTKPIKSNICIKANLIICLLNIPFA